jgi:hypothetical protein
MGTISQRVDLIAGFMNIGPCTSKAEMSYLRKVEMSLSLPEIKAWEANFGVGDDEQAGLAADRSVD